MRYLRRSFGLLSVAFALAAASACSSQGEGQRCDKNSGDTDCAAGLVCTTVTSNATGSSTSASSQGELPRAICCPPQGQSATTAACSSVNSGFDAGASVPALDGSAGGAAGAGGEAGAAGAGGGGGGATGGSGGVSGDAAVGGRTTDASTDGSALDASTEAGR